MSSPTQRSLALLRDQGFPANVVEKWIAQARKRVDLFGCIDIVALDHAPGVLGVQTTTASNLAARIKKAAEIPEIREWLDRGNRLHFHGWKKSKLTRRWECTVRTASLELGRFMTAAVVPSIAGMSNAIAWTACGCRKLGASPADHREFCKPKRSAQEK